MSAAGKDLIGPTAVLRVERLGRVSDVYTFSGGAVHDEPEAKDKSVAAATGAYLAEMAGIGLPVPPGRRVRLHFHPFGALTASAKLINQHYAKRS
jgi:hypothetical protein